MFEYLTAFLDKATSFVPRFQKVAPTDRLIKWSRCQEATLHGPGLVWYWPIITEVEQVDTRWRSTVTCAQTVTLADGTTVSARTLTRWKPSDIVLAVSSEADYSDTVAETAQGVLVDVLSSIDGTLLKNTKALSVALTLDLQAQMREIGIQVKKCTFTELCITPAFRLINE